MNQVIDIKSYLKEQSVKVDLALEQLLTPQKEHSEKLFESMRYSLFAGGKRLRPVLVVAAYQALGGCNEGIYDIAVSTELIHTYSLIHDDLPAMDDDDFRRGNPTNHKVFSEGMAVLAGDAMQTLAFQVIGQSKSFSDNIKAALICELAESAGAHGMVGGQAEDLLSATKKVSEEKLKFIHLSKTAALIRASVKMGAIAAEASEEVLDKFNDFGEKIGLAFQIIDDVLDEISDQETLGKSIGKDVKQEKITYPSLFGLNKSKEIAQKLIDESLQLISFMKGDANYLKELALFITTRRY